MSEELFRRIEETVPDGDLIRYESVQRWVLNLPKSFFKKDGTKRYTYYLHEFRLFLDWLGEPDPDRLLKTRFEQLASGEIQVRRRLEERVKEYYKTSLNQRIALSGARKGQLVSDSIKMGALTAISSWAKNNYADLTKLNIKRKTRRVTRDYWFTLDDIRAMCGVATPIMRAYILTELALGLRRGDCLFLEWEDLWLEVSTAPEGEIVGPLRIFTEKYQVEARPFLTSDAVKALKNLRYYQEERGTLGAYVFEKNSKPLSGDHVNRRLQVLFKRAGLESQGRTVRTHGLRKMLFNEMKNVGVPVDVRKMIVGKSVSEDIATYVSDDELKKHYSSVLPRISIMEPRPEVMSDIRREFEERIRDQASEIRDLREGLRKIMEILELKEQIRKEKS